MFELHIRGLQLLIFTLSPREETTCTLEALEIPLKLVQIASQRFRLFRRASLVEFCDMLAKKDGVIVMIPLRKVVLGQFFAPLDRTHAVECQS